MQSHEFFRRAVDVLGSRRVSRILGFKNERSVYPLCHPTLEDDPDGQGTRNPADRMDDLRDALASHDAGRVLLMDWQLREEAEHSRRMGRKPVERSARELGEAIREFGDVVAVCGDPAQWKAEDAEKVLREGLEALAELGDLVRAAAGHLEEARRRPNLRAG